MKQQCKGLHVGSRILWEVDILIYVEWGEGKEVVYAAAVVIMKRIKKSPRKENGKPSEYRC